MTDWGAFAGFSGVVVLLFLLLARASQSMLPPTEHAAPSAQRPGVRAGPVDVHHEPAAPPDEVSDDAGDQTVAERPVATSGERSLAGTRSLSTGELLANVLLTQGLFGGLIVAGAVFWGVPASALGVGRPTLATVGAGLAVGAGLYVADEVGATWAASVGVDHDETVRALLAPDSRSGWLLLLGAVLPVIAVAEELVFRGVLVGALAAGFDLPVWGLAVASSVLFALGHGAQGRGGVLVTGVLGLALAAAFVLSESLLLVVVAHYVVNALQFVVHEGLGVEWAG